MRRSAATLALAAGLLGACSQAAPEPAPRETRLPEELRQKRTVTPAAQVAGATPMEERVAVIGLLNKRNNLTQELRLKPGEAQRIGDVIVRLAACERTAPWEMPKETGAFVQVLTRVRGTQDQFARIFSGWLFKNSPGLNVVEHPIYDVWVKDCTMAFPGEEGGPPADGDSGGDRDAPVSPAAPRPSASATAAASPAATPEPADENADTA